MTDTNDSDGTPGGKNQSVPMIYEVDLREVLVGMTGKTDPDECEIESVYLKDDGGTAKVRCRWDRPESEGDGGD